MRHTDLFFRFVDPAHNSIISVMVASTLKTVCYNADCGHQWLLKVAYLCDFR
jgi:hypothetical protein